LRGATGPAIQHNQILCLPPQIPLPNFLENIFKQLKCHFQCGALFVAGVVFSELLMLLFIADAVFGEGLKVRLARNVVFYNRKCLW